MKQKMLIIFLLINFTPFFVLQRPLNASGIDGVGQTPMIPGKSPVREAVKLLRELETTRKNLKGRIEKLDELIQIANSIKILTLDLNNKYKSYLKVTNKYKAHCDVDKMIAQKSKRAIGKFERSEKYRNHTWFVQNTINECDKEVKQLIKMRNKYAKYLNNLVEAAHAAEEVAKVSARRNDKYRIQYEMARVQKSLLETYSSGVENDVSLNRALEKFRREQGR
ncbi:MAG: hypothetical protein HQL69_02590 [Magnetococcales bacterium]|nr:hypothetical protein [Magnetococcales bacterium]